MVQLCFQDYWDCWLRLLSSSGSFTKFAQTAAAAAAQCPKALLPISCLDDAPHLSCKFPKRALSITLIFSPQVGTSTATLICPIVSSMSVRSSMNTYGRVVNAHNVIEPKSLVHGHMVRHLKASY